MSLYFCIISLYLLSMQASFIESVYFDYENCGKPLLLHLGTLLVIIKTNCSR